MKKQSVLVLCAVSIVALFSFASAETGKKCMYISAPDGAENAQFDQYMIPRLEAWGYALDRRLSSELPQLTASDYEPYDFIFLSETVHSSHMSPLKGIPKPMLCADGLAVKESSLAFGLGDPGGVLEPSQPIIILDSAKDHPLAAGFAPGTVLDLATVEDEPQPALLIWGKPTIPVIAIAGVKSDPTQLAVYGIEKGTLDATGGKIQNRVVVVGPHAWAYDDLTEAGEALYKAGIEWILTH
jgi:hypothetical protein